MGNPFRDDLLEDLRSRHEHVLVIVGAGVSISASKNPLATWPGLLRDGVDYCRSAGADRKWASIRRAQISRGEVNELISAAGEISNELRERNLYEKWLRRSIGSLELQDGSVIGALGRLGVPIWTTNYDNLIEKAIHQVPVTRGNPRFLEVARGEAPGVLHLHGHYLEPATVVLGIKDYLGVEANKPAQAVQQAVSLMKTLLLVGFGGGLDDPNFRALRKWMGEVLKDSHYQHYRLCLESELAGLQQQHTHEHIRPISFGADHDQLADFLKALGDDLWGPGKGPPESSSATSATTVRAPAPVPAPARGSEAGTSTEAGTSPGTDTRVGIGTRATRAGTRSRPPRWRKPAVLWPAGLVVLVGVLLLILVSQFDDGSCDIPQELVVLTTPTKEGRVRELAVAFSDEKQERCRESSVTVFSVPSSATVADALVGRWPRDDLARLGPEPAVWMPDATAEVEQVNQRLGDDLKSLGSIATSPVVLAVPESAMARVGEDRTVPWRTILGWARRPAPGSRVRIGRPDPSSSTAGLLATIGLNQWSGGPTTGNSRHAVEQAVDAVADELTELCQLAAPGRPARAVLVSEQVMVDYNKGRLGGPCDAREGRPERLTAVYAADGTPVLDHPFVLLPAAAAPEGRAELADRFFAYLSGPEVQARLRDFGFRDAARNVGGSIGAADGVLVHDPPAWAEPLDGPTLDQEVDAWEKARLPARALLAMDVSGSMSEELPGPGGERITAAREAAKRAVGLMGDKDQIGLWRFSQSLDGPSRDYQELVPLGPAGSRDGGGLGRDQVVETLDGLLATNEDTGLYDTIHAGIRKLRAGGGPADAVDALIVVTDGQNDDRNGGVGLGDVVDRLQDGKDVLVFLLTFGPARCDAGELETLTTGQPDRVRCLDGDRLGLERAFEQVAATLWGTGGPAAGGAGVAP